MMNTTLKRTELADMIRENFRFAMSKSEKKVVISNKDIIHFYKEEKLVNVECLDSDEEEYKLSNADLAKLERYYYKGKVSLDDLKSLVILLESEVLKQDIDRMVNFYYDVIRRNFVVRDLFFTIAKDGEILLSTEVIL